MAKLQPISALRRRAHGAATTERFLYTWGRLSGAWRLASVAIVLLLLAGSVAVGCMLFSSSDWGSKLAGIAAVVAVLYAGYQVRLTRAIAKQTLAYQYFERFSRYSLDDPYAAAKAFAFSRPDGEAEEDRRWEEFKRWEADNPTKARDILFIFNFFEELGGVYRHGAVDRRVINEYLGGFALKFWGELPWFIDRIREDRTPSLFEDWEEMSHAVERALDHKRQSRARFPPQR